MRRLAVLGLLAVIGACSATLEPPEFAIDRRAAAQATADPLTLEEAGLLASRGLIEIYGLDADPVRTRVEGHEDTLARQTMWRLDLEVDVTVDGSRVDHRWSMWIGTPLEGDSASAVLRAQRTDH